MRPWILRTIPMLIVPIALVAAVAMFGPGQQSDDRPTESNRLPVIDQMAPAPARLARAQEESIPIPDEQPVPADEMSTDQIPADQTATDQMTEQPAPAVVEVPPGEQPSVSAPVPTSTPEPAQPAAAPGETNPAPVAGAPTATTDFAAAMQAPAMQTAIATMIAQFQGMAPMLPPVPVGSGQQQGAPPAAQTQAAIMMATLTTPQ